MAGDLTRIIRSRLDEALGDGQWVDREKVVRAGIPAVPPGVATRRYARRLTKARTRKGQAEGGRELTMDEQIASGARTIINERINSMMRSGRIERKEMDGRVYLRRGDTRPFGPGAGEKQKTAAPQTATILSPSPLRWRSSSPRRRAQA